MESKVEEVLIISDVDAHSQCRMKASIKEGKLLKIGGVLTDPESKGELTLRGKHMKEIIYASDRILHPLRRVGKRGEDRWERVSWDEALNTITKKLNETKGKYGAESIDFHYGHYHSGDVSSYLVRLANLIGTPNVSTPNHVCHVPRIFIQFYFDFGVVVPPDVAHTKCIILWGGNPENTNKPQSIAIKEARDRGAKLIVIDPRFIPYSEEADIHAQLRPGTDGALALGLLNVIIKEGLYDREFVERWTNGFDRLEKHIERYSPEYVAEITWVPAEKIREIARLYASTKPACISPRNALDQHTNSSCAIRAIDILMTITGNLDVKGGNVIEIPVVMGLQDISLNNKLPSEIRKKNLGADRCLFPKIFKEFPSTHTPTLWNAIINGDPYPIKAMFIMAANPALTCANSKIVEEALRMLEFLVVVDMFMTPTAKLADIVLPACSFIEKTRYAIYSIHADHWWNSPSRIVLSPKAIEPLGESWSDWKIICELAGKMGYGEYFPWKNREESIDFELEPFGITCEKLKQHTDGIKIPIPPVLYKKFRGFFGGFIRRILEMTMFKDYPLIYRKYGGFMKRFNTPSKKIEIYSERLEKLGYDPLPVYREPAESPISKPDLAKE